MINRLSAFFLSQRQLLNRWQLPLAGLLLMGGLAATVSTLQAAAPHKQTQAVKSTAVAPPVEAAVPQQQDQIVDSTAVAPPVEAAVPQQQAPADYPTAVKPPVEAAAPHKQEESVDSTAVTKPLTKWNRQAQAVPKQTIAQLPTSEASLPDGTYLYGQSSQSQQIGKEYLIFEASQGKVTGAMYLPSSEYSCFHGTLDSKQMNLTVVNPYDQTAFSHSIARAQPAHIAAAGGQINLQNTYDTVTYPHTVQLEGYQPISKVSDNDQQVLNLCRNNSYQQTSN
ncbi:MAG: hypothetical protein ICV55_03025 [Coleofasciculus sp. C3-bin4]|nr:hypothetical protein [Coleofasciculus sp. C3-bin4]